MRTLQLLAVLLALTTYTQGASLFFNPWSSDGGQAIIRKMYDWDDSKQTTTQPTPAHETTTQPTPAPAPCHGLETPKYKVMNKTPEYEKRSYYEVNRWMTANQTGPCYDLAELMLYTKLFLYFKGWNQQKQRLRMTCPVVEGITAGTLSTDPSNYQIFFYLAPEVKVPPTPNDQAVFMHTDKPIVAYVSSFPGFATEHKFSKQASKLLTALEKAKVKVNTKTYFVVGYDAPYRLHQRHNEIWFLPE